MTAQVFHHLNRRAQREITVQNQNTTTRRRALQLGSIAAIAAGLMGTAPAVQAEAPAPMTIAPVIYDDLGAGSRAALEELREVGEQYHALSKAFTGTFTPQQRELWFELESVMSHRDSLDQDLKFLEVMRHFPGLAPALWAVYREHEIGWLNRIGTCCMSTEEE